MGTGFSLFIGSGSGSGISLFIEMYLEWVCVLQESGHPQNDKGEGHGTMLYSCQVTMLCIVQASMVQEDDQCHQEQQSAGSALIRLWLVGRTVKVATIVLPSHHGRTFR